VILRHVTVTGNEASDSETSPPSGMKCPHADCPFALAAGVGGFNGGNLALVQSTVSDDPLDGPFSDADGAGIYSAIGTLKVISSMATGNTAELVASWPVKGQGVPINVDANSGGIHVGGDLPADMTDECRHDRACRGLAYRASLGRLRGTTHLLVVLGEHGDIGPE
jgi:hypothetical protein